VYHALGLPACVGVTNLCTGVAYQPALGLPTCWGSFLYWGSHHFPLLGSTSLPATGEHITSRYWGTHHSLSRGKILLDHTKLVSEVLKLHFRQRLSQHVCYMFIGSNILEQVSHHSLLPLAGRILWTQIRLCTSLGYLSATCLIFVDQLGSRHSLPFWSQNQGKYIYPSPYDWLPPRSL
jgi:hypothetical protein